MNPFITYPDMKNFYSNQAIDLKFQVDHIYSKKIQLFEENRGDLANTRLFFVIIRHIEIEMVSE